MDPLAEPFRIPADLVDASDRTGKSISRLLERICGGDGCVHTIRTALVQALERRGIDGEARVPWYFPTPDDYASRLERAGFRIDSKALIPRRTLLPGDIIWWLEIFAQSFVHGFSDSDRQDYLDEVRSVSGAAVARWKRNLDRRLCPAAILRDEGGAKLHGAHRD